MATTAASVAPTGAASARLDWLVEQINANSGDPAIVARGFAPTFLDEIPIEQLIAVVGQAVSGGTNWVVVDDAGLGPTEGAAVIESAEGAKVTVRLAVEAGGEHRLEMLLLEPVLAQVFAPGEVATPGVFDMALRDVGGRVGMGLFDVTNGDCRLLHGIDPETPLPIGSAFKLWVLDALAVEVEAGRASWNETMPITAELISSPDGEVASQPVGTPMTLRRLAELMISISDNTATDHLMARVGRDAVERSMSASGVADPARNIPMLSTREFFLIKYGRTLPATEYVAMDADTRRIALDDRLAGVQLADDIPADVDWGTPAHIDTVEWFASPLDQCRTHVRLAQLASRAGLEPIVEILRLNPGVPFDPRWTDVRFKGGSETGVVFTSWRLERADGLVVVLAGGVADPDAGVDSVRAASTLAAGVELVD